MKLQMKRELFFTLALMLTASLAQAGGVVESLPEPMVQVVRTVPLARPVVPTVRPRVRCVFVPVATHVEPAQTYVNQGLSVTNCCCDGITFTGSSVTLPSSVSVQQEMHCDVEGDR